MTLPGIHTKFIFPPIPDRRFDWMAWHDGQEELGEYGYGKTEIEAVADLTENYPEQ
jgi:hypothetical protein